MPNLSPIRERSEESKRSRRDRKWEEYEQFERNGHLSSTKRYEMMRHFLGFKNWR